MKTWFENFKYDVYKTLGDWWYPFSRILFPRQRWLTKQIPNSWVDKDWLWETCLIEGLKHYVEQDSGNEWFSHLDDSSMWIADGFVSQEYQDNSRNFHRETKYHYDLVTKTLPDLERQLKDAWAKVPPTDFTKLSDPNRPPYLVTYGEIDRLDKMIDNLKTEVMLWCVNNRASIWT